jgi:hypothetical protein
MNRIGASGVWHDKVVKIEAGWRFGEGQPEMWEAIIDRQI